MRLSAGEKLEIIELVTRSEIGVTKTLKELGIHKSTFYNWYNLYLKKRYEGFFSSPSFNRKQWNSIPEEEKTLWQRSYWSILDFPVENWPTKSSMSRIFLFRIRRV